MAITPDTKDWTWVLERPCDECGFDAAALDVADAGRQAVVMSRRWRDALARPDAGERPDDTTWSVLEYGCHVTDILMLFSLRLRDVAVEDTPVIKDFDQDQAALDRRYDLQDPERVAGTIYLAARNFAAMVDGVVDWERRARRMPWTFFTADQLVRYAMHDLVHHLHDVQA